MTSTAISGAGERERHHRRAQAQLQRHAGRGQLDLRGRRHPIRELLRPAGPCLHATGRGPLLPLARGRWEDHEHRSDAAHAGDMVEFAVSQSDSQVTDSVIDLTHRFIATRNGTGSGTSQGITVGDYPVVSGSTTSGVPNFGTLAFTSALVNGYPLGSASTGLQDDDLYASSTGPLRSRPPTPAVIRRCSRPSSSTPDRESCGGCQPTKIVAFGYAEACECDGKEHVMTAQTPAQFGRETATDGSFQRQAYPFADLITADGSSGYPAVPGRYHLYVSLACPWAHRAVIVRRLKKLEEVISLSVVDPIRDERGWAFRDGPGYSVDPVNGFSFLSEAYQATDPSFEGRYTVPVLWDRVSKRIVSNNFPQITVMFETEFEAYADTGIDLYPSRLRPEIDAVNAVIYEDVNNGVYKCGFATTQEAYEQSL